MAQNYVLLERIELNASASSVTFSNIPQTGYTDLKLVYSGRTDRSGAITSDIYLQFNGITTATYSFKRIYGTGTGSPASDGLTNNSQGGFAGAADGASGTANTFSNAEVYIPNYVGGSAKAWSVDAVTEHNGTGVLTTLQAGLWSGTSAITSITVKDYNAANWVAGSTFSLYGVAALGTTPAVAPKADGGNVIATDGTYWYHAFLSNGTFTPQQNLTTDVFVVAGGGAGGGNNNAGGGGAGGYRYLTSQSATNANALTVTVGAGGSPALTTRVSGSNSSISGTGFTTISATGGGGGGCSVSGADTGLSGGSGGGAAYNVTGAGSGNAGGYSPVEGYAGADGIGSPSFQGGGGGGAGAAPSTGGAGGTGSNSLSTWATATSTGVSGYYAGGGGGGTNGTAAAAAAGGGGRGAASTVGGNTDPTAGTVNTGSGGGGGVSSKNSGYGAAGGSGIIIIRYPIAS